MKKINCVGALALIATAAAVGCHRGRAAEESCTLFEGPAEDSAHATRESVRLTANEVAAFTAAGLTVTKEGQSKDRYFLDVKRVDSVSIVQQAEPRAASVTHAAAVPSLSDGSDSCHNRPSLPGYDRQRNEMSKRNSAESIAHR